MILRGRYHQLSEDTAEVTVLEDGKPVWTETVALFTIGRARWKGGPITRRNNPTRTAKWKIMRKVKNNYLYYNQ